MALILQLYNTYLCPATTGLLDLGSSDKQWKDIYITGTAYIDALVNEGDMSMSDFDITSIDKLEGYDAGLFIDMGQDSQILISSDGAGTPFATPDIDITGSVYFDDDIGIVLDKKILFGDTGVYILSDDNGYLDLVADIGIRCNGNTKINQITLQGITNFVFYENDLVSVDNDVLYYD